MVPVCRLRHEWVFGGYEKVEGDMKGEKGYDRVEGDARGGGGCEGWRGIRGVEGDTRGSIL